MVFVVFLFYFKGESILYVLREFFKWVLGIYGNSYYKVRL